MALGQTQLCFAFVNKVLLAQSQAQCFIVMAAVMLQGLSVLTHDLDSLRLVVSLVAGFSVAVGLASVTSPGLLAATAGINPVSFSHVLSFVSWCPSQLCSSVVALSTHRITTETTLAVPGPYSNFVCQNVSF